MGFSSAACSLQWFQNSLVLRRGQSTIQILPDDTSTLRTLKDETAFTEYFRGTALKNREARRVFLAWEKKDENLLKSIFSEVSAS